MKNKSMSLNGEWRMVIAENKEVVKNNLTICRMADMEQDGYVNISATVPGNFELDMKRAGLIEDPFFGTNIWEMQALENRHIWYGKTFSYEGDPDQAYLLFEGIDTFADIYLNGACIASVDNMLIPHEIKAPNMLCGVNDLVVHIKPAVIMARSLGSSAECYGMKYNYNSLRVRKAPHMYGWDITPRAVSAGLWRPVSVITKSADRIDDLFIYTGTINHKDGWAILGCYFEVAVSEDSLKGYRLKVTGQCGDFSFSAEEDLWHTSEKMKITVLNPQLWWPGSLGAPNLYDVTVELYKDGESVDVKKLRTGIRTVELNRSSVTDYNGAGEFCFAVNGEKFFANGTNWVPVDAFHSRDKERLPQALALLKDIGCNAVRCWGGNVYEDDLFYDFCDENGIIIWQDFAMACGIYPQDDTFCRALDKEVEAVVKRLRNHASIAVWAGDNECDIAFEFWDSIRRDPNTNVLTRKVIPNALQRADGTRLYLPSSPYVDEQAFGKGMEVLPEFHLWGPRDNFKSKFYTTSMAHFASEIGYAGCVSPRSAKKFISQSKLWPWQDNEEWVAHAASPEYGESAAYAYRVELMAKQVYELFGTAPDSLEDFARASQISQAEAFKFFIEMFRTAKWRRTGIIWWNLLDGWPQFSDAVVDYYFNKKLAYGFIKRASSPVCLMFKEPDNWQIELVAVNDTLAPVEVHYVVTDLTDNDRLIFEGDASVPANGISCVQRLKYSMSEAHFYLIKWEMNGVWHKNHYFSGSPPLDMDRYLSCLEKAELADFEGF